MKMEPDLALLIEFARRQPENRWEDEYHGTNDLEQLKKEFRERLYKDLPSSVEVDLVKLTGVHMTSTAPYTQPPFPTNPYYDQNGNPISIQPETEIDVLNKINASLVDLNRNFNTYIKLLKKIHNLEHVDIR